MGVEAVVFSSSLTLFAMSCVSLVLALLFHLRFRRLSSVAGEESVGVFSRTFNVFDPYPDRLKLFNSFLTVLPLVVLACTGAVLFLFMEVLAAGLLLSLVVIVVCLNLLVVEGAFDVYHSAKTFVGAFTRGAALGEGDLRVFRTVREALPKMSNYYLGLAGAFAVFGVALPYSAPWLSAAFVKVVDFAFKGGAAVGYPPFTVPFVWLVCVFAVVFVVRKIKSRLSRTVFSYLTNLR